MKAILIDSYSREVREVEYNGLLEDIYALIKCSTIDVVRASPLGDTIYVDDCGLINGTTVGFTFRAGFNTPLLVLAGSGLVVSVNDEGEDCPPNIPLEAVIASVKFVKLNPELYNETT